MKEPEGVYSSGLLSFAEEGQQLVLRHICRGAADGRVDQPDDKRALRVRMFEVPSGCLKLVQGFPGEIEVGSACDAAVIRFVQINDVAAFSIHNIRAWLVIVPGVGAANEPGAPVLGAVYLKRDLRSKIASEDYGVVGRHLRIEFLRKHVVEVAPSLVDDVCIDGLGVGVGWFGGGDCKNNEQNGNQGAEREHRSRGPAVEQFIEPLAESRSR